MHDTIGDTNNLFAHKQPKVRSNDPAALKDAFEILQKMDDIILLELGDRILDLPVIGLVLYYLHLIQLNETSDVLPNVPDYAIKAFQNIEGCASTADQRTRACMYAQMHILFSTLEVALIDKVCLYGFQKSIERIHLLGAKMPSSIRARLEKFDLDLTKDHNENFRILSEMRDAMKQALDLP